MIIFSRAGHWCTGWGWGLRRENSWPMLQRKDKKFEIESMCSNWVAVRHLLKLMCVHLWWPWSIGWDWCDLDNVSAGRLGAQTGQIIGITRVSLWHVCDKTRVKSWKTRAAYGPEQRRWWINWRPQLRNQKAEGKQVSTLEAGEGWSESGRCEFYDFQGKATPENDQVQGTVTKVGEWNDLEVRRTRNQGPRFWTAFTFYKRPLNCAWEEEGCGDRCQHVW